MAPSPDASCCHRHCLSTTPTWWSTTLPLGSSLLLRSLPAQMCCLRRCSLGSPACLVGLMSVNGLLNFDRCLLQELASLSGWLCCPAEVNRLSLWHLQLFSSGGVVGCLTHYNVDFYHLMLLRKLCYCHTCCHYVSLGLR